MITNPYTSAMQRKDAVRQGRFNVTLVRDVLYKQLRSVLPDYLHGQIDEAYFFDDPAMKAELTAMMIQASLSIDEMEYV